MERDDEMNEAYKQEVGTESDWNLRGLRKSAKDKKIAGVCGGFGENTPIPSWLWRAAFVISLFAGGMGLIAYIILWVCMPGAKSDP